MKEYLFQLNNVSAGSQIEIADAPAGLAVKNILAIVNKTTKTPVHSPMDEHISSVAYSGTTLQINLDNSAPTIAGNLLIKAYLDGDAADQVAQFLGLPEALPSGYEFMTDSEVTDGLEDIMQALDPDLTAAQAASITAQAMQIINPSQS